MKTFAVLLLLGAQVCYISGFSSVKEGKCPTPKGIKKCFLKKRICFMDIECRGKMKCCPDVCGNNVCTRAIIPPGPTVGSCPADDRVVRSNMQNNKCRQKRTKYCFKDNCKKCCYYRSTCNPHPNLLNSLEACEKDLCARKKCRGQGEICQLNKRRQKVKCVCPKRCPNPNGDESVCGTDKITYISPCEMNLTACVLGDRIAIDYRGPCRKNKVTISQGHVDSVTLKAGTNGSVVCQFKGHPIQIVWNKAGIDRLPEDRMLPYDNMLYIRLVRKEDAGKYLCSAFDGVSTVTATVNVSVVVPELVTSKAIQPRRICMQPKLTGPGRDFKVRYYFNSKTRLCEPFVYGGTGGNNNNFKSSERCKRACYHSATPSEICRLPKRPGGCRRIMPKWYFDSIQGKCKIFHYGGCDGNANRFNNEQECLQTCSNLACRLPKAVGNCKAYLARWFFNVVSQQCEKFMYTGCEGNANQYPSLEHCKMKCMKAGARQGPGYKKLTVKPGMCPKFDVARCGDFMWDRCMVDTDCKGSEKCCYNGCIKKCFRPNRKSKKPFSPVKLGVCPPPSFSGKVCSNRYQTNMCLVDQDCPGEHKCCYNGCNSDCVLPPKIPNGKPKPGICPLADVINPNLCGKSTNECSSDGDCYGPFKCCFTGCHQECLPVPKPRTKPGQCPVQDYIDPEICFDSADRCAFDEQCPGSSKCCFTGCKLECLSPPGISRPGICPRTWKGRNGNCDRRGDSCKADSDCGVGNRKCCFNGCQKDCIAPHQPQPGCPKPWKKPDGICDRLSDACQSDSECPSNGKCCFNGCQKYCETGIKPTPPKKPEPVGQCPKPWKDKRFCDNMGDSCRDESDCFGHYRCCYNGCQKDCVKPVNLTKCQIERQKALDQLNDEFPPVGLFVPTCEKSGHYTDKQCHGHVGHCWCVGKDGNEISGTRTPGPLNCDKKDLCEGVTCPFHGMCQAHSNGSTSCVCQMGCTFDYRPVCGSDGVTHTNLCSMKATACSTKTMITVDYDGECKKNGSGLKCLSYQCADSKLNIFGKCETTETVCSSMMDRCTRLSVTVQAIPGIASSIFRQEIGMCITQQICASEMACGSLNSSGIAVKSCKVHCCIGDNCNTPTFNSSKKVDKCPKPWKGQNGICDRRGDSCKSNDFCKFGKICCFNGCQKDCVYPDGASPCQKEANRLSNMMNIGHFTPSCHANGHYNKVQCHGSTGYCWCSDIYGNEKPNTRIRGRPNCNLNAIPGAVPGVNASCPQLSKGRDGICDRMADQCTIDSTCSGTNDKCCFNGCQRECIDVLAPPTDLCEGVTCPFHGMCEADSNGNTSCVCQMACNFDYRPVCGSDGVTHANLCSMKATACSTKTMITVDHDGECKQDKLECWTYMCQSGSGPLLGNSSCEPKKIQCVAPNNRCLKTSVTIEPVPGMILKQEIGNCTLDMVCESGLVCNTINSTGVDVKSCKVECCKGDMCNKPTIPQTPKPDKQKCPKPWKGDKGFCDLRGSMCDSSSDCNFGKICCFNGCQKDCVYPDGQSPCHKNRKDGEAKSAQGMVGNFIPSCHADGHYDRVQCSGSSGYCWCADEEGNERPNTRIRGRPNCNLNAIPGAVRGVNASCPQPSKGRDGICDRMGDQCTTDSTCSGTNDKCCFNGCQRECIDVLAPPKDLCEGVTCPFEGICQANSDGSTSCICPSICTADYKLVCGSTNKTYGNLCAMKVESCQTESIITVIYDGECKKGKTVGNKDCPKPWKGSQGFCDYRGDMCDTKNDDCELGQICCHNGCQNDCVFPVGKSPCQKQLKSAPGQFVPMVGQFVPSCQANGHYNKVQCHPSTGYCWCSDMFGNELPFTHTRGKPNCNLPSIPGYVPGVNGTCPQPYKGLEGICDRMGDMCTLDNDCNENKKCCFNGCQRECMNATPAIPPPVIIPELSQCQKKLKETKRVPGLYLPTCNVDGDFTPVQCHTSVGECWCVNVNNGEEITSTRINTRGGAIRNCSDEAFTKCQRHYRDSLDNPPMGRFLPSCEDGGKYDPMQCHGSVGHCWCVDDDGNELNGTRVRGRPDCSPIANPCDGVKCGFNAVCQASKDGSTSCECPLACPANYAPVCGSDVNTYSNECEMKTVSCTKKMMITVVSDGECPKPPCDNIKCSHKMQQCLVVNDKPVCECPKMKCSDSYSPVCGTDGKVYRNSCQLMNSACSTSQDIDVAYHGECIDKESCDGIRCTHPQQMCTVLNNKAVCECPQYQCPEEGKKEVCGTDKTTYDGPCEMESYACHYNMNITVAHKGKCKGGDADPCAVQMCAHPLQTCQVMSGKAKCICRKVTTTEYMPVCASDGKTYPNTMTMENAGCERNMALTIVKRGKCDEPDPCEKVSCSHPQQSCRAVNGSAKCVCRMMANKKYAPVCASDGKTYSNTMIMQNAGCEKDMVLTIVKRGKCSGQPKPKDLCEDACSYPESKCTVVNNTATCECPTACTRDINPVCGSDGVTYDNMCLLEVEACEPENVDKLTLNHKGACKSSSVNSSNPCEISLCAFPTIRCEVEKGQPVCKCPQICTAIYAPVCASDGKTYPSDCKLAAEACKPEYNGSLTKLHNGACPPSSVNSSNPCEISLCDFPTIQCEVEKGQPVCKCPQSCTEIYDPVCASDGKTYPSDCNLAAEACKPEYNGSLTKFHNGACPPQDPCEISLCSYPDTVCVTINGSATCKCPEVCTKEHRPVCGTDGKTYSNSCNLNVEACKPENRNTLRKKHDGPCPKASKASSINSSNPCEISLCAFPTIRCEVEKGQPVCKCPQICTEIYAPVCASDGKTYPSDCKLAAEACKPEYNGSLTMLHKGACPPQDPCEISLCSYPDTVCITINGSATCKCPEVCTRELRPVCGTDGKTYPNSCNLNVQACKPENRQTLRKQHDGPCKSKRQCPRVDLKPCPPVLVGGNCTSDNDCSKSMMCCHTGCARQCVPPQKSPSPRGNDNFNPCDITLCAFPSIKCIVNKGQPKCMCPTSCNRKRAPVCGTDGKTYSNLCTFATSVCNTGGQLRKHLSVLKHDACTAKDVCGLKPASGPCFAYIPSYFFNKTSGKCEQFTFGGCQGNENRFTSKKKCQDACGAFKPCDFVKCSKPYATCKEDNLGLAQCVCPRFCPKLHQPVVASNGKTYSNPCLMRVASCESGIRIVAKPRPKPGPPGAPGKCPATDPKPCPPGPKIAGCKDDSQCAGTHKCCHDGCSKRCVMQMITPPRQCPQINPKKCDRKYDKKEYCKINADCPRSQICCFDGCIKRCDFFGPSPPGGRPGGHHGGAPGSRPGGRPGSRPGMGHGRGQAGNN